MPLYLVSVRVYANEFCEEYEHTIGIYDSLEKAQDCVKTEHLDDWEIADFFIEEYKLNGGGGRFVSRVGSEER